MNSLGVGDIIALVRIEADIFSVATDLFRQGRFGIG